MPGSSPMVVKIIRGAPGVGKSTIAQKVASKLSTNKVAHISVDALQHFDCRAAASKDKLKLGVFHAVLVTRSFISEGFSVVVDYVFDENGNIVIELHIVVAYGVSIKAVTDNLMQSVKYKVEDFTSFKVSQINVFVEDVKVMD